jgi:hypothetical protein
VQTRELANVPEHARRRMRRLQRLYVEEWVTVLSELFPGALQTGLRTAVHAMFGLLNSTPYSASELPAEAMAELLHAMARAALTAAASGLCVRIAAASCRSDRFTASSRISALRTFPVTVIAHQVKPRCRTSSVKRGLTGRAENPFRT